MEEFPDCLKPVSIDHTLEPGQIMYIPSTWAHEVTSIEDSLSVTTNFFPQCRTSIISKPFAQWITKQEKGRHMMEMVRVLKEGKKRMNAEKREQAKIDEMSDGAEKEAAQKAFDEKKAAGEAEREAQAAKEVGK